MSGVAAACGDSLTMEINRSNSDLSYDVDELRLPAAARTRATNTAVDLVKSAVRSLTNDDRKLVLISSFASLARCSVCKKRAGFFQSFLQR